MLQLSFVNFKANSYLLVEGNSASDKFYIIQKGKIRCFHEVPIPGINPTVLGPGDFVGVIPCMSGHSQTESVIAMTDVVAILVKREQYPDLIKQNTPIAMKIVRAFTREMRILNDTLAKLTLKAAVVESPEQLYAIAAYYEHASYVDIAAFGYYQYIKECPDGINIEEAKKRFVALKKRARPVYLEPNEDNIREYPKDTMVFSEHQSGGDMFIIQDGSVKISKVVEGEEVTLALLRKGDMFGEMALLENKPRSANAIAHEPCHLMVVNHKNFDVMVSTQPQMIARLTTMLAERLWAMYRQLSNTQLRDLRAKMIDMLSLQVERQKIPVVKGQPYHTNLTLVDVTNLCGIAIHDQPEAVRQLENTENIKISYGKVIVPDLVELFKQAAFYRKQNSKHVKNDD